jgi:hypothetical protein
MKLTRGEYCCFGLKSRLRLLKEFGCLVCEEHMNQVKILIYKLYDFFVEVLVDIHTRAVLKAEPLLSLAMLDFYQNKQNEDT